MNGFETSARYDRIVSVEIFEFSDPQDTSCLLLIKEGDSTQAYGLMYSQQ